MSPNLFYYLGIRGRTGITESIACAEWIKYFIFYQYTYSKCNKQEDVNKDNLLITTRKWQPDLIFKKVLELFLRNLLLSGYSPLKQSLNLLKWSHAYSAFRIQTSFKGVVWSAELMPIYFTPIFAKTGYHLQFSCGWLILEFCLLWISTTSKNVLYILKRLLQFLWFWYGAVLTFGSFMLVGDWLGLML